MKAAPRQVSKVAVVSQSGPIGGTSKSSQAGYLINFVSMHTRNYFKTKYSYYYATILFIHNFLGGAIVVVRRPQANFDSNLASVDTVVHMENSGGRFSL